MKLNTFLVTTACVGTLLVTSCNDSMKERQLRYTHTTDADGDAYQFFQIVGRKVPYEIDYASYVEGTSVSAQTKSLASKIKEEFSSILPELDALATERNVDFPIKGALAFASPDSNPTVDNNTVDSLQTVGEAEPARVVTDENYLQHVKSQLATVKDQFKRVSRNTDKDLRDYAASKLEVLDELYHLAGGEVSGHAHH